MVKTPDALVRRVQSVRARLSDGPVRTRPVERDFENVSVPLPDCDCLRDALVAQGAGVVIEVGLAYASSALAIAEALLTAGRDDPRHIVIDPFQFSSFTGVGWEALCAAGVEHQTTLIVEPSSVALARLLGDGVSADAAFVDGSHRFHEVFVDLSSFESSCARGA
ncbi:MAG TPA: class I SAM-dependent methyltransferase [Actinomycetota bacterium]|nr:class I SAM-dependent methyltransferase [Actinomycetota bacterium]